MNKWKKAWVKVQYPSKIKIRIKDYNWILCKVVDNIAIYVLQEYELWYKVAQNIITSDIVKCPSTDSLSSSSNILQAEYREQPYSN